MLKTDLKAEATKTRRLNLYPNTVCMYNELLSICKVNITASGAIKT